MYCSNDEGSPKSFGRTMNFEKGFIMAAEINRQWLAWARREGLGNSVQIEAAVQAATEAISRGATSEQAAAKAREAASILGASASGPPNNQQSSTPSDSQLAPGGITWEVAMNNAAYVMSKLPRESTWKSGRDNVAVELNIALAQGWIAFARELTMHSRGKR
jgi:hypothetical protein